VLDSVQKYEDARGYHYVGMSKSWKKLCLDLPDSPRVKIPPLYETQWIDTTIAGQPVLIQAWNGDCPHALRGLPGGIGGEVGIYRRDDARQIPDALQIPALAEFPAAWRPEIAKIASALIEHAVGLAEEGVERWWPYPQLNAQIEMSFSHGGRPFFTADPPEPADGYWMSRWMGYGSYVKYVAHELLHGHTVPLRTAEYTMDFTVGGKAFRWDAFDSPIVAL